MIQVVGLGAGGHARVLIEILLASGEWEIVGLLDPARVGESLAGIPIIGGDEQLDRMRREGITGAFIGIGGVGDNSPRMALFNLAISAGFDVVNVIHSQATISRSARLGRGVAVTAGALINSNASIGDNVIINTGAIIEHDCQIGSHCHIATGAVLAGNVTVGESAHVGAGATVRQGIVIGENAVVGAGAVVVKDVAPRTIVTGTPARPLRQV
jgi:UDP-perosamine 4-acetyltransferase